MGYLKRSLPDCWESIRRLWQDGREKNIGLQKDLLITWSKLTFAVAKFYDSDSEPEGYFMAPAVFCRIYSFFWVFPLNSKSLWYSSSNQVRVFMIQAHSPSDIFKSLFFLGWVIRFLIIRAFL